MGFHSSRRNRSRPRGSLIAALDVGSTKVCCLIARVEDDGGLRVVGIGHQVSRGVKGGAIIDMDAAETAIGNAVHAAEQMAGETIQQLVVSVSGNALASQSLGVEVAINGHEVGESDVRRALAQARQAETPGERELIHAIPVTFTIDQTHGIQDPRGMFGQMLGVNIHAVTARMPVLRNLASCIARSHLDVEAYCAAPYAAGLSCLVEDEYNLGVTCIDMGGGTTSIAVFAEGAMIHCDSIPVGGLHVTNDIARGLSTPVAQAERMKSLHGSAMAATVDEREMIEVPQIGEETAGDYTQIPKSLLNQIIQPRLEETLELVRSRLETSGFSKVIGRRVVLTGGASQLHGIRDLAQVILDKQVRLARPFPLPGLAEATDGPAFATTTGLLHYAQQHVSDVPDPSVHEPHSPTGLLGRVSHWLKEHL